uniref:NADH-ubiquinone oxidoreductase chain 2 n=3 Tax=Agama atra TaxID=52208 RepID=Q9G357_AGAAT|nr:NADH dehydrogenase subunit 2 [Agama atra]
MTTVLPTPLIIMCLLTPATSLAIVSNHWVLAWAGLELSMMITLLLLQKPKTPRSNEATIKYFITQTIASTMMLAAAMINFIYNGTWNITQLDNKLSTTMAIISLALKMGAAPVHFWLPEVLQGSPLPAAIIITTWQKIAPTVLMFMIWKNGHYWTLMMISLLSIFVGGFGAINQPQMRKMVAFSSINSTGWTLMMMILDTYLALLNVLLYINLISVILYMMEKIPAKTLQNWTMTHLQAQTMGLLVGLTTLATSGLPPTSGWAPKMASLDRMLDQYELTTMATLLSLMTLITLLFYIRLSYISAMTSSPSTSNVQTKWRPKEHVTMWLPVLASNILTTFLLLPVTLAY